MRNQRLLKLWLTMLISLFFSVTGIAQRVINGVVEDAKTNSPLSGATIIVKNSKKNAVTNADGKFQLNVPNEKVVLQITFVGYVSRSVTIENTETTVLIKLSVNASVNSLSEVVMVGVQRQSKRNTTAAISTVLARDIENLPAPSVDQLLQGRIAGINVQITSGEPGVTPTLVVRGNSRLTTNINDNSVAQAHALSGPLYVIDGVPVSTDDISAGAGAASTGTNYLAGININDIERVDVQKDAAATAAWGSRGANGVIYIVTKKGVSKTPEFRVNMYNGITQQPKLLTTSTGSAERAVKMKLFNDYGSYGSQSRIPQILTDRFNPSFNNATDWQGLFYRYGAIQNVDATMSAANENFSYRISGNYYNEKGIIKAFGLARYSLRGNFNFTISPKLTSQFIFAVSKTDRQRGRKFNNSDDNTPVSSFNQPSSLFGLNSFDSSNFNGLYSKLRNKNINDYYSASLTVNYSILPNLKYTFQGAANITASNKDYFQPSNIDEVAAGQGNIQPSYAESDKSTYSTYFLSNTLNFTKKITGKEHVHNFAVTASQQFDADVSNSNSVWGSNIPSNNIQVVSGVPQTDLGGGSNYAADGLLSFVGQVQYDFDGKYLLYGSYRTDASSRFGSNSKWGTFPSVGAGWIVSDEKFMDKFKNIIPYMKLRASWGISGSQSTDLYAPYNSYTIPGTYNGNIAVQPSYNNGLTKNDLTWAKSTQKNIGLDGQLFGSRISFSVDMYEKLSKNDYYNFQLPFFTGFGNINFNAKDLWINNRGVDITIGTKNFSHSSSVQWNMQITASFNKNVIAKLPNNNRTFLVDAGRSAIRLYAVGQPIYQMYQMIYGGVYTNINQLPFNPNTGAVRTYRGGWSPIQVGQPIFLNQANSNDIWNFGDTGGDGIPSGDPNPKVTGGWVNDFTYKNFSLSLLSIFTWKRTIINSFKQQQIEQIVGGDISSFANGRMPDLSGLNYWIPQNSKSNPNYQPTFGSLDPFGGYYSQYASASTLFNEDGSYFKLKNIVLAYQLPRSIIKKAKIKNVKFYAIVDNVFTLSKSTVPDPEAIDQLGNYSGGLYPLSKKFTFGIDVQF